MKLSIGELERLTGMSRTTLRYYDAEGLIDPERMENGYRHYSQEDLISLVQLKQLQSFGIELSELPSTKKEISFRDAQNTLVLREQAIDEEIEKLYQKLARLRLHVEVLQHCGENTVVREGRMIGAYRLYFPSAQKPHPRTADIFKRWMEAVPDTYPLVRIPRTALLLPPDAVCPVETGIGLLGGAFRRLNEAWEDPIEYSPPCKCIGGMIQVKRLDQIPRTALNPFEEYVKKNGTIPLGDFHGWVAYAPVNHERDSYQIYMRLGIH